MSAFVTTWTVVSDVTWQVVLSSCVAFVTPWTAVTRCGRLSSELSICRHAIDHSDVIGWLLNVPATYEHISGTDQLRQLYVLPHWLLSSPVTVY